MPDRGHDGAKLGDPGRDVDARGARGGRLPGFPGGRLLGEDPAARLGQLLAA